MPDTSEERRKYISFVVWAIIALVLIALAVLLWRFLRGPVNSLSTPSPVGTTPREELDYLAAHTTTPPAPSATEIKKILDSHKDDAASSIHISPATLDRIEQKKQEMNL